MLLLGSVLALKLLTLGAGDTPTRPPQTTHGGIKMPMFPHPDRDPPAQASHPRAIRSLDARGLVTSAAGKVNASAVLYADLTGDGREEAIVPLQASTAAGTVAIAVFGYDAHGAIAQLLFRQGAKLKASIKDGKLEITEPVEQQGAPLKLRQTLYAWDGQALVEQPVLAPSP
jgi:hypothetical protein